MKLVAFLGDDKENWGQITALINRTDADGIILIKNKSAEAFPANEKCEVINVNSEKPLVELKKEIMDKLKIKIEREFDVCLSIASGNGKEHMALLAALLSIPVGVRFVIYTKNGIEFIS